MCRKVSQQVAVNRLKKILPFELRLGIFGAFIAPHFNSCSESWHHCGKKGCANLEKINKRALRFVTRDKSTMYETLLKQLNLLSSLIKELLKWPLVSTKLSMGMKSLKEYVLLHERSTNYNFRGKHILELPKVNTTTYGLKSWRYTAAKIWNALPDQFRAAALHEVRFVFSIIIRKISSELLNYDARIVSENVNAIKQIIVEPANEPSTNFCVRIIHFKLIYILPITRARNLKFE